MAFHSHLLFEQVPDSSSPSSLDPPNRRAAQFAPNTGDRGTGQPQAPAGPQSLLMSLSRLLLAGCIQLRENTDNPVNIVNTMHIKARERQAFHFAAYGFRAGELPPCCSSAAPGTSEQAKP